MNRTTGILAGLGTWVFLAPAMGAAPFSARLEASSDRSGAVKAATDMLDAISADVASLQGRITDYRAQVDDLRHLFSQTGAAELIFAELMAVAADAERVEKSLDLLAVDTATVRRSLESIAAEKIYSRYLASLLDGAFSLLGKVEAQIDKSRTSLEQLYGEIDLLRSALG